MFQQGGKIYLNTSNWKRYHRLNTNNNSNNNNNNNNSNKFNDKDKPEDIDNLTPKLSKFSCSLQPLNRFKTRIINSQKTGLRKVNSIYSVSSVKERLANEAGTNTGIDIYRLKQKMANTLSVMTNVLRNVVSKQRIRYKEKGFNLDLAYICDNIIAMGYPADNYESMYRNPLGDVYKFLEDNHHDHYKIYNLCLERSYDITKFHGRVSVYPFEDHNPPTIELILKFCEDMDSWLKAHTLNVAAVHCKAGKGRTGTMICCYLVFCGLYPTADEALACYDEKRTKDRKGVTIPSQRRYVQYFSTLMRLGLPYERRTLQFCEIRFAKANTLHNQGTVHCSISVLQDKVQQLQNFPIDFRKHNILDMKNPSLPVAGDIKVELTKNTKKIFHFWFNTFFVTDSSVIEGEGSDVKFVYTLQKWEIDEVHKDKCYPEDFKVELVFYIDDNNVDRDHLRVSASNRVTSNNRNTKQNDGTIRMSLQHQHQHHQQSNNYSLPQNNSSGSEINLTCDQKSSSSISVSSSLGVGGTDTSNGYESNRSTTRSVAPSLSNHCGNHYTMTKDVNNGMVYSASPSAHHMVVPPPSYMENNLTQYKQDQQHKNNTAIVASTANQRHFQRKFTVGCSGDTVGGDDAHVFHANNTDVNVTCQLPKCSSNNSTNNGSNSYNHNQHHRNSNSNSNSNNSSKTSSVSSQSSSSAIGDNEEDWESGESQAKQLENITLLLSTATLINPPTLNVNLSPFTTTTTCPTPHNPQPTTVSNNSRNLKNHSSDISNPSNTSTTFSASTSTYVPFSTSHNCPSNNKCKTSNSSCTNRVVGGDDDDDKTNDDNNKITFKKLNTNQVVKPQVPPTSNTDNSVKSVEFKDKDNNISSSIAGSKHDHPTSSNRPKLMHLLMAPKQQPQQPESSYKPIFKRKFSKLKKVSNCNSINASAEVACRKDLVDPLTAHTVSTGSGSGVANTSKLKLKIKLKKNKFKLSQKFQWFQSYFRSDPVDFCENLVQQTTSMRHNSMSSMASRTHKLSTTTPPSITPPLPTMCVIKSDSTCELLDRATSVHSVSTSNASIATGDLCEDYYSSICDNQLSFSNSPCKSPRSMADMSSSISGAGSVSHCGSLGRNFGKNAGVANLYLRERRETLPHANGRRNNGSGNGNGNVVIVAAKPAKMHAIGFNVNNVTNLATQESFETNAEDDNDDDSVESPASIYYTPSTVLIPTSDTSEHTHTNTTAFVFPETDMTASSDNLVEKACSVLPLKPQAKYSLNLVIVKECPEPPISYAETENPQLAKASNNIEADGIDVDYCDNSHKRMMLQDDIDSANVSEDLEIDKMKNRTAATASVCSNSSSSGFCASEFCTTNSSSSSCNCNPFLMELEKFNNKPEQQQQQSSKEIQKIANIDDK